MVRISQERQRFICVGGDGTINEIVNSAPCNPDVEFGVIPSGSGNDFTRNFSNRKNFTNIDSQIDGDTVSLDLIKCNEYYCVNMVNIGFDCAVVKEAAKIKKIKFFSPGISYILGVVVVLFRKFGTKMKLIFDDGEIIEKEFTLTAIGNGKFCGGGFKSAPTALLEDGLMDVCSINKVSRATFLNLVSSYKKGTHLVPKNDNVLSANTVKTLDMIFEGVQSISIDGELNDVDRELHIEALCGALKFIVPAGCTFLKEESTAKEALEV